MAQQSAGPKLVPFKYFALRNISAPEDLESGRKVFAGQAPIEAILGLDTNENVRDFLLEAEGIKRRQPTQVHLAIRETLEQRPESFSVLNGGITIVARDHEVDEKEKVVRLLAPSIINGSQTQGIVRQYANGLASAGMPLPSIHVKFEIIVTDDDALVADVSIARNFQNDVAPVSIVGRKGQLEELDAVLKARFGEVELRKSETEISRALSLKEDYIFTEKLMQVMTALVPDSLWWGPGGAEAPNKAYTYSAKARCLKDFSRIYEAAKNPNHPEHLIAARRYQFFLEIAPQAIELYEEWKTHQGFAGTGLRSILRDGRSVEEVPDGMVFPILAALSKFAKRTSKGWKIVRPSQFRDSDLIGAVKRTYMHVAKSNPNTMGKSFACYAALYEITGIYQRLIHESPEAFE